MSEKSQNKSFFEKIATIIVDKRNLIFFLYICALIFSIISQSWVKVCDDLTEYLPDDTETRQGLTIMEDEMVTFGTARVMVSNTTYEIAEKIADQLEEIEGITTVEFDDSSDHFVGADALFSITFEGENEDAVSLNAMHQLKDTLAPYDYYVFSEVGYSTSDTLDEEMNVILLIAVVIIVLVLLFTSHAYAEVPILLLTFGTAALLNMGSNYWLGEISFVSDSVTVVLQLALAIDYAIILLHRFTEEREVFEPREACIAALSKAIPEISASSLTTISGLMAMMFMQFQIGFDMGIILIKAILYSLLSVFTLMPGLLVLFSKALEKTRHRNFVPKINLWGKFVMKLRYVVPPVFVLFLIVGFFMSNNCPYVYGYSNIDTSRKNERQIAEKKINEVFGTQNIMALLLPKGDYDSEKALLADLEAYDEVDFAMGLANVEAIEDYDYTLTDSLTPRQFSEMLDLDYEPAMLLYGAYAADSENYGKVVSGLDSYAVPLMDMLLFLYDQKEEGYVSLDDEMEQDLNDVYEQLTDARAQLLGEEHSRLLISLNLPEESEKTFAFLKTIHSVADKYYNSDQVFLVGDSTSDYDLSTSFARDNVMISVLSVVFVIIVLLFTFKSVGLPILLILVIQGSIWINFTFPTISGTPLFFMSYLIVSSIQMGANIDYAIVISSRYQELKKEMPVQKAIIQTLNLAFPTVLTSGTILATAGIIIGKLSTEPAIVGIGECLGRGTIISMILVMGVLPQILILGDLLVEKTRFSIKMPERTQTASGVMYVDGRVRGRVSGVVDATMHGIIRGEISAVVDSDSLKVEAKEAPDIEETE